MMKMLTKQEAGTMYEVFEFFAQAYELVDDRKALERRVNKLWDKLAQLIPDPRWNR